MSGTISPDPVGSNLVQAIDQLDTTRVYWPANPSCGSSASAGVAPQRWRHAPRRVSFQFGAVTYIWRQQTTGGSAAKTAWSVGQIVQVRYAATYEFYTANP